MYGKLMHGIHWLIEINVLPHGTKLILKKSSKMCKINNKIMKSIGKWTKDIKRSF